MQAFIKILDSIWNIKFLTGYRSIVARIFLVGVSAYQWVSTAAPTAFIGSKLPDIPSEVYVALVAYFGLKLEQFAKEHAP
jgi:hypothetical protein